MTTIAAERGARPLVRPFVAGDLVSARPLVLEAHTPIRKAAALLQHHEVAEAPVLDVHGQPIGVVTATACAEWENYSRRVCPHADHADCLDWSPVSNVLVPQIAVFAETAPCDELVEALLQQRRERVYVIDDEGELIGALGSADVLRRVMPMESLQLAS